MSEKLCLAQEWVRDGRGLWAMRACRQYYQHTTPHDFEPWRYNVQPPAAGEAPEGMERIGTITYDFANETIDYSLDAPKPAGETPAQPERAEE